MNGLELIFVHGVCEFGAFYSNTILLITVFIYVLFNPNAFLFFGVRANIQKQNLTKLSSIHKT